MAQSTRREGDSIDRRFGGDAAHPPFGRRRPLRSTRAPFGWLTIVIFIGASALPTELVVAQDSGPAVHMVAPADQTPADPNSPPRQPEIVKAADPTLARLQAKLRESERALAAFRASQDASGEDVSSVSDLEKASADTAAKLVTYQQITYLRPDGTDLDAISELVHSPRLDQLRAQMTDLNRRESDLSAMYGPAYPALAQVRAQRVGLERTIGSEVKRLTAELKRDYEAASAHEAALRKQSSAARDPGKPDESEVRLRDLERINGANKAAVDAFVGSAKEAPLPANPQAAPDATPAVDRQPEMPPPAATQGGSAVGILVGLAGGLIIGLWLAVFWRKRGGPRLMRRSSNAAAKPNTARSDPFILGRVPTIGPSGSVPRLWTHLEGSPDSDFARSIEALVATIAPRRDEGLVVALSPLSLGEGATSIAACLAHGAGLAGKRVLLIDADPKGPNLTSLFEVAGRAGLAEVLRGDLSAGKAVAHQPNFSFLPIGRRPWATRESRKSLRSFLAETRRRFDLVLIDTPAFDAGPDALTLDALADCFALVASSDRLLRDPFIAAIDTVADKRGFAGVILNRAASSDAEDLAVAV